MRRFFVESWRKEEPAEEYWQGFLKRYFDQSLRISPENATPLSGSDYGRIGEIYLIKGGLDKGKGGLDKGNVLKLLRPEHFKGFFDSGRVSRPMKTLLLEAEALKCLGPLSEKGKVPKLIRTGKGWGGRPGIVMSFLPVWGERAEKQWRSLSPVDCLQFLIAATELLSEAEKLGVLQLAPELESMGYLSEKGKVCMVDFGGVNIRRMGQHNLFPYLGADFETAKKKAMLTWSKMMKEATSFGREDYIRGFYEIKRGVEGQEFRDFGEIKTALVDVLLEAGR